MTRVDFIGKWEQISTLVYNLICINARSTDDANDIFQNTALYAFEHMDDLRSLGAFRAWVTRIAISKTKDFYRGKGWQSVEYVREKDGRAYGADEYITTKLTVMDFIDTLSEEDRKLLMMKYFYGLSLNEISQVTGIKYASLYYRLNKAGEQIDKYLYSSE